MNLNLFFASGLQNDYKAIMKKIEEGLHKIHGLTGTNTKDIQGFAAAAAPSAPAALEESVYLEPFLRVNLVTPGSPAESAVS